MTTVGWLTADLDASRMAVRLTTGATPVGTARVTLWRVSPSGALAYVRGCPPPGAAAATPIVVRDYEAPLGVALNYYGEAFDAGAASLGVVGPLAFELAAEATDDPWLCDIALPVNSRPVIVESLGALRHEAAAGVHRVLGRRDPVVTTDIAYSYTAELVFVTVTADDEAAARAALGNGLPILLRTPPEHGVGNAYLSVLDFQSDRVSRIALYDERRFTASVVQVGRPDPALFPPVPPTTYKYVKESWPTYAAVLADRATYDALLNTPPAAGTSPITPWPPDDV